MLFRLMAVLGVCDEIGKVILFTFSRIYTLGPSTSPDELNDNYATAKAVDALWCKHDTDGARLS